MPPGSFASFVLATQTVSALASQLRKIALREWETQKLLPFEDRHLFGAVKKEVRIIGEEAAYIDGAKAMQQVMFEAFCEIDSNGMETIREPFTMAKFALSELNYAWDGIDHWQA